jgi:UDP-N-acetylmuramate dehydrogenase
VTDLSELTTIRVGGPVTTLVTATTRDEVIETAREAWASREPLLVLGGGSNLLVSDEGFDGTVLRIATHGIDGAVIQAGEPWDAVVAHAVAGGLAGIEALSGIPGAAGAAPIQNIGAYGQELSDTLVAVDLLEPDGTVIRMPAAELDLGYRSSALRRGRPGIVLSIELGLRPGDSVVRYEQLAKTLGVGIGARVPIADVRESVLALRRSKGMVLDPADPDSVSCGSFFTNPIVGENFARALPADAPRFPVDQPPADAAVPLGEEPAMPAPEDEGVKLSAGWLIERCGISRGFALPGSRAAISSKHTLAIVNRGGASADEVAELARFVHARVLAEFGVRLQVEPILVGIQV